MPTRIAIIKPSALGDIIHSLPVLTALRELHPLAHISWIVNAGFESLLSGHPHLNATLPFDRGFFSKNKLRGARYLLQFSNTLRRQRFDLVLDLQGLLRTGLMCAATGAPVRIGFDNAREGSHFAYTHRVAVPDAEHIHAIDRYWRIVESLGGAGLRKQFVVPLKSEDLADAKRELEGFPRPWVAVAVGAKWITKRWPPAHFADLLKQAQAEFGGTAVFVGASDDTALSAEASSLLAGRSLNLVGRTSLPRLAAVFSLCDAMLGNDTGPLHLAAALGKPCVAPYTCTKIALHGPYGGRHAVETKVACAGSYFKKCPNNMICMTDLTPQKLWPEFRSVLANAVKS